MHVDSSQRTWTNPHDNPLIDDSGDDGDSGGGVDGDSGGDDGDVEAKRSSGLSEGDAIGDSPSSEEGTAGGGGAGSTDSAAPVGSGLVSAVLIAAAAVCYFVLCVLALWKPSIDITGGSSLNSSCPLPFLLLQHRGGGGGGVQGSCNWTSVGRRDGIDSFVTRIVGSPVSASRGVAVVDGHVALVVGTFLDMDSTSTWTDYQRLSQMSVHEVEQRSTSSASTAAADLVPVPRRRQDKHDDSKNKMKKASSDRRSVAEKVSSFMRRVFHRDRDSNTQQKVSEHSTLVPAEAAAASTRHLVYQHYDQQWPLPDRDLLLLREMTLYHTHKKVTADSYADDSWSHYTALHVMMMIEMEMMTIDIPPSFCCRW